ncbi:MAG: GNAT family N-acetyltransferase [Chitinophagaceae bacterium]
MFEVRRAGTEDFTTIKELYKKVAAIPGGIARNISEITDDYIKGFMNRSATHGIELVVTLPGKKEEVIAEIHCYTPGIEKFSHVLDELTIAVAPDFQGKGIGKLIFTELLSQIEKEKLHILRVELFTQESNIRAISFYKQLGFKEEGRFENKIKMDGDQLEADIPMAWFNKNYKSSIAL